MSLLWLVSVIWAFSFGLIKVYMVGVNPYYLSFLRLGLSLLFFLPFLRSGSLNKSSFLKYLGLGSLQFGFMYIFYLQAFIYLPAWQIALFTITTPIYVTLINDLFVKKFHWKNMLAALLSFAGAYIIKLPAEEMQLFLTGFILVQLSNISFAIGQIGYKYLSDKEKIKKDKEVFAVMYLGGVLITLIGAIIFTGDVDYHLRPAQVGVVLYLGIVASGICFFLWNLGGRKTSAAGLAIMNNMKIPLAILASVIVFKESLEPIRFLVGSLLISLGFLTMIRKSDKDSGKNT
ncbi:MAG: EamA family transporter [Candidatus Cloacimonetes bacterium]|nr:EamA family transporter [Candidatus Cloacimonadota bacterium]